MVQPFGGELHLRRAERLVVCVDARRFTERSVFLQGFGILISGTLDHVTGTMLRWQAR